MRATCLHRDSQRVVWIKIAISRLEEVFDDVLRGKYKVDSTVSDARARKRKSCLARQKIHKRFRDLPWQTGISLELNFYKIWKFAETEIRDKSEIRKSYAYMRKSDRAHIRLRENRVNSIGEEFISLARRIITSEKNGSGIIGRMLNYRVSWMELRNRAILRNRERSSLAINYLTLSPWVCGNLHLYNVLC